MKCPPEVELKIEQAVDNHRRESDEKYAPMVVKTIVFGFIALICVAFVTWLTKQVW